MTRKPRQYILGPDDPRNPVPRRRHGLTVAQIIAIKANGCHICRRTDRPLDIDHDHLHHPGPEGCPFCIRGALCHRCNMVVRYIDDNPEIADAMAAYLRRFGA